MNQRQVHELYHKEVKLQRKIIGDRNFTYRNILGLLNKVIDGDKLQILDVGSGVGTLDFYLAKKVGAIYGIDISKKAVSIAKKNAKLFGLTNLKFYIGNVNKFKFTSKFDLILCSEIIEHVEDDRKLLGDLRKHLKKTGLIFISTPLESAPLYKWHLTKEFDKRVGHLRRYNLKMLNDLAKNNGLKIVNVYYEDGVFRNIFFVFKFFDPVVRVANRFPFISDILTHIDTISLKLFGPTDICLLIKRNENRN